MPASGSPCWLGQGARGCVEELTQVADLLGRGGCEALLARTCCPTTCRGSPAPSAAWHDGELATLMMECDTLLTVGSNFPYSQFLPELDQGSRGADRPIG